MSRVQGGVRAAPRSGKRRKRKKKKRGGARGAGGVGGVRGARRPGGARGMRGPAGPPRRRPRCHCVCTACGVKVPLYTDVPCYVMTCPKCGLGMVKEGAKKPPVDDDSQPPNI